MDKVQKRKDKLKPKKLFSINSVVYDDGIICGVCIEYRDLGRLKNQKVVVPSEDDFISSVRSILPSSLGYIRKLVNMIFTDVDNHDVDGASKIARVTVDIYSDGFVDADFGEIVQGQRGAPKTWRLAPNEFYQYIESRVGKLSPPFRALHSPEDIDEDELPEENTEKTAMIS